MDILSTIVSYKKSVIARAKNILPVSQMLLSSEPKNFSATILAQNAKKTPCIIAEIKKASPSKGVIVENLDIPTIAKNYEEGGATCISVLTDEKFFQGANQNIAIAKKHASLPILRKDFIIDKYQIYESKHIGADAILLIASILTAKQMQEFEEIATSLGLSVLVEVHSQEEMQQALGATKTPLVGINNRNLKNFSINLENTINLLKMLPNGKVPICESGISTKEEIKTMQNAGCNTFLIGTSIMKSQHQLVFLRNLLQ